MITEANRRWWILAAMTGTLSMILLDATVVSVALPSIQRELDMGQTELQWVVNSYLLALAALVAVGGRLADMVDRVGVLIAGIVVFMLASAACGLAQSEEALIAARAAEGVGAAMMVPPTAAIVISSFAIEERGKAMGVYAGVSMIFLSVGPLVGGLLTEHLDWRWVFWVNLPVGAVTIGLVLLTRPESRIEPGQRLDLPGLATLVPGLAAVVLALMESSTWGWGSPATIGLLAGGLALLIAFVLVERRTSQPLVELRLFASRNFRGDTLVLFCVQFALVALTVFGAIYLQDMLDFSPVEAGLALLPVTLPLLVAAPVAGRIYDRIGPRWPVATGTALAAAGFAWQALLLHDFSYARLVPGYLLVGFGIGLVMSPANTDAMSSAAAELRGQASGVIQTMRQVGGTVGLAIVGTIVANVQRDRLEDFLGGAGASPEQIERVERVLAEDHGGRTEIAAAVPRAELAEVLEGAHDAVTDGVAASFWASGAILAVAAVIAFTVLRRVRYAT